PAGPSDLLARMDAFEARDEALDRGAVHAVSHVRAELRRHVRGGSRAQGDDGLLLATLAAFPDRVARRRAPRQPEARFAGGGAGRRSPQRVVRDPELLVAVHAEESRGEVVVRAASAIEPEWLVELFPERVVDRREIRFDPTTERVDAVSATYYDGL